MIQKFASERNIKIIATLYSGLTDEQKKEAFAPLYEAYHRSSNNFRFRMPHLNSKYHAAIKERGFTIEELNQIEAYDGTESTLKMMREMIDVVKEYW